MQGYTTSTDWETQWVKDASSSQTDLWIQCNSNQSPSSFFGVNRRILKLMGKRKGTNIMESRVSKTCHSQRLGYNPKETRKCDSFSRQPTEANPDVTQMLDSVDKDFKASISLGSRM